ncbi:hypothetical protein [Amycolatopsis sp. NPDC059657]|uniref:hypothetical protein n=1 Tax=Amycolatopsis sp. NPDC059657 TaxID=3346899 RepID=UPI00366E387E
MNIDATTVVAQLDLWAEEPGTMIAADGCPPCAGTLATACTTISCASSQAGC